MAKKVHKLLLDNQPMDPGFYYFDNWTAKQENKVHKGECGECRFGLILKGKQVRGEKGVWVGPFATVDLAKDYVKRLLKPAPEIHNCV